MKNILKILIFIIITFCQFSCKTQIDSFPTTATLIVPAKGDLKIFENKQHSSYYINIKNKSVKNSCEAYIIKMGNKKWISPSLPVNGELNFYVPKNSSVLLENYSDENILVSYTID